MKNKNQSIIHFLLLMFFIIGTLYYQEIRSENHTQNKIQQKEISPVINSNSKLKVYFIDVGQADACLIENNSEYMLIDAGNNEDGSKLVKYFHELNINEFSFVVGTHAHEDHIGGMDDIIRNFNIKNFYMPDVVTTTKTFEDVLDALEEKQIPFQTPEIDETFSLADCKFQLLHIGDETNDLNDSSIVLKMTYGNHRFLFMGDATSKVEKELLKKEISSDVIKLGHHGSKYSTSTSFLEKVNPKYAIISVGSGNSYHHPHQSTLKKLQENAIKVYRTDKDGTIIATSDGTNLTFETMKTDTEG